MSWVKLDDQFADNVKVASLSDSAFRLYVTSLCYCASQLTDGRIARQVVKRIGWASSDLESDVEELIEARLWDSIDEDYLVHDYLDYNPSKTDVLATRQARAEAGSIGGQASAQAKAQAKAQANEQQNSTPSPSPSPFPDHNPSQDIAADEPPPVKRRKDDDIDKRVRPLVDAFTKAWGYPPANYAAESAAAKKALRDYEPADLLACYRYLKLTDFWKDKHLGIASVHKQVGQWLTSGRSNGSRASPHKAAISAFLEGEP